MIWGYPDSGNHRILKLFVAAVETKEPRHKHHDVVKVTRHTEYSHGHPIPPHDLVTVTKHTEYSYGHPPPHLVKVTRPMIYSHSHPPPPHDVVRVDKAHGVLLWAATSARCGQGVRARGVSASCNRDWRAHRAVGFQLSSWLFRDVDFWV